MIPEKPSRADTLADAAIDVLADEGLRGLTHRAVEQRAGLPNGSTTYYFKTRSALVRGVLARLLELDRQEFQTFGLAGLPPSRATLVDAATKLLRHLSTTARNRQIARFQLYLDGDPDDERKAMLDAATQAIEASSIAMLKLLGSKNARRDGKLLQALLDGLLYDQVARQQTSTAELRRRVKLVLDAVVPPPKTADNPG
ncbi:TetR/AcrR family transcriptional regulator [Tenggerimyces flavus]|uniref:TetR/AcrR family transcriptional regulator n=1 Tax=Tenggerimyces flavus TaxID=1708749 RepID=A0ABV7YBE6_9ACTN|nr:TetR family transcriptional regulator [Tenggerimyces flavus]MBM7785737.1 DNA-binding transcriptional regulator YbjK [Tenggerimyces flavus]